MIQSRPVFAVLAIATCILATLPAVADSQARIVRLSDVQGGVQIDKSSGMGFESAFLNLPVTQGTQLRTGPRGRAEVEFEDGSTLRLTPGTTVLFTSLGANDEGKRTSTVSLKSGIAYINWLGKSGDSFKLTAAAESVELAQAAHFRASETDTGTEIANFKNEIEVVDPTGTAAVPKKKMVTFSSGADHSPAIAKLTDIPYDEWDRQSVSYHDDYAKSKVTTAGYGSSDLNYYGSYNNVSGYGSLWQPYFAGAGWNPYMDGAWSYYPGMGYTWASSYPWGWLPYYYGNWVFAPGFGWGWQPGASNTWRSGVHYVGATAPGFIPPVVPKGTTNTFVVGRSSTAVNSAPTSSVRLSSASAGLGLARGSNNDLHTLSSEVSKRGAVSVRPAPQFSAGPRFGGGGFAALGRASDPVAARSAAVPAAASAGHAGGHR